MYQFTFYVPESHLETVKTAIFDAGAGRYKNYDACCWQCKGEGQYRSLAGSNPFHGSINEITKASEYKVEVICDETVMPAVMAAFIKAHPYEEPAYAVSSLLSF